MSNNISEELPGKEKEESSSKSSGGSNDQSSEKKVRQAVYDIRYRARREEIDLRHAYTQYMSNSGLTNQEAAMVKEKLFGKGETESQAESLAIESVSDAVHKVFNKEAYTVHTADQKAKTPAWIGYKEGKKNKLTGEPLYKKGDDVKEAQELPANIAAALSRLEKKRISKGGNPDDSPLPSMRRKKRVKKGDWIGPPPKKKVNEAKVDTVKKLDDEEKEDARNYRKYGTKHNQFMQAVRRRSEHRTERGVKKIKGQKPAPKGAYGEEFIADSAPVAPPSSKKITGQGVDNSKLIKVFPNDKSDPETGSIKSSYEMRGSRIVELANKLKEDSDYGYDVWGNSKNPEDVKKREAKIKKDGGEDPRSMYAKWNAPKNHLRSMGLKMSYEPEINAAVEYFYEQGINEEGLDLIIEEVGIETFVEFVLNSVQDLNEERAARKMNVRTKKTIGATIEKDKAAEAKRQASKTHEYKETPKKKPKVGPPSYTTKVTGATEKAKAKQPAKKPSKQGLGSKIRGAFRDAKARDIKGVRKVRDAVRKVQKSEFGKGVVSGAKAAVKAAKDVHSITQVNKKKTVNMQSYELEGEENLDEIAPALAAIPAVLGKVAVVGAKGAAIAGKAAAKGAVVAGKAAGKAAVKGGKVAVKGTKKAAKKIGDAAVQKAKDVVIQKAQDVAVDAIAKRKERHSQETVAASYKPESSVIRSIVEGDAAFAKVAGDLKKKYGSGVLVGKEKPPAPTEAEKKAYAAHKAKIAKQDTRDDLEKSSQGRYSRKYSNRGSD